MNPLHQICSAFVGAFLIALLCYALASSLFPDAYSTFYGQQDRLKFNLREKEIVDEQNWQWCRTKYEIWKEGEVQP